MKSVPLVEVAKVTAPLLVVAKPVPMAVMVPVFAVKHTPPTETQPVETAMPFANVVVPVPVTARLVVEAFMSSVLPVSVEDAMIAERLALN